MGRIMTTFTRNVQNFWNDKDNWFYSYFNNSQWKQFAKWYDNRIKRFRGNVEYDPKGNHKKYKIRTPKEHFHLHALYTLVKWAGQDDAIDGRTARRIASAIDEELQTIQVHNYPDKHAQVLERQISEAWEWVNYQFETDYDLEEIPHILHFHTNSHKGWCRHRMLANNGLRKASWFKIQIGLERDFFITYGRNSIGYRAPYMKVDKLEHSWLLQLIHEFTHLIENYLEFQKGRKHVGSEINTTIFELRYVREYFPQYWENVEKVKDGRRKEWRTLV